MKKKNNINVTIKSEKFCLEYIFNFFFFFVQDNFYWKFVLFSYEILIGHSAHVKWDQS